MAVMKYIKADLGLSWPAPSSPSRVGTDSTEAICAIQGITPATAWPVMIACVYSPTPKPVTNANTPFWHRAVAMLATKTMTIKNTKYPFAETCRQRVADSARRVKQTVLRTKDAMMRWG